MSIFKRKIPPLFKNILGILVDKAVKWKGDDFTIWSGGLKIWVANRPYADMQINNRKPPRWFARKMRPLTDKILNQLIIDSINKDTPHA